MTEKTQTGTATKEPGKGGPASEGKGGPASEGKVGSSSERKVSSSSERKVSSSSERTVGSSSEGKVGPASDNEIKPLPTEKPVPSAPVKSTSQYVVTVDNRTGLPVKIEKLSDDTGARKELSMDEYARFLGYTSLASSPSSVGFSGSAPAYGSSEATALVQAYYQGVTDYFKALVNPK
jgi:hypothetical protein